MRICSLLNCIFLFFFIISRPVFVFGMEQVEPSKVQQVFAGRARVSDDQPKSDFPLRRTWQEIEQDHAHKLTFLHGHLLPQMQLPFEKRTHIPLERAHEWAQAGYDPEHAELGGAAATLYGVEMVEDGQEFAQRRALMQAVLTGCEVKHHMVLLPGREDAIPPAVAAQWINSAMDEAVAKEERGESIVTAHDVLVREYQEMQVRVWKFLQCADLLESDTEDKELIEMLHINRMLRIGALANGNEEQIREYGTKKPVFLSEIVKNAVPVHQHHQDQHQHQQDQDHQVIDEQFSKAVSLTKPLKKKRTCRCFPFSLRRAHKKE